MNPESICCSLETSKKLQEAGWGRGTVFAWAQFKDLSERPFELCRIDMLNLDDYNWYPAPTSAEIELPGTDQHTYFTDGKYLDGTCVEGKPFRIFDGVTHFDGETEVEAKAKMWLYLKEGDLI